MKWNKMSEIKPKDGDQIMIYRRGEYEIGDVDMFSEQPRWYDNAEDAARFTPEEIAKFRRLDDEQIGRIKAFGYSYYFNDKDLYWMALPNPPYDIACGAV